METKDKLAVFQGWAETGRKWSSVMDAKAGFISAFSAALLAFIWNGLQLTKLGGLALTLGTASFSFALLSVILALVVVLPRTRLQDIFGRGAIYADGFKPLSFFAYVADNFPKGTDKDFMNQAASLGGAEFERESLEQHFTISHVVSIKAKWVRRAAISLLTAIGLAGITSLLVLLA